MKAFQTYESFISENTAQSGELIGLLFQSRDIAHIAHLITDSYAKHKALNEYYDELLGLIDRFVEAYQGEIGKLTTLTIPESTSSVDIVGHLDNLMKDVNNWKEKDYFKSLTAILDEIVELIATTLYKLKELK